MHHITLQQHNTQSSDFTPVNMSAAAVSKMCGELHVHGLDPAPKPLNRWTGKAYRAKNERSVKNKEK